MSSSGYIGKQITRLDTSIAIGKLSLQEDGRDLYIGNSEISG